MTIYDPKYKIPIIIGLVFTALMTIAMYYGFQPLEQVERDIYDAQFKIRGTQGHPDKVVIAAIDEKSIEKLGRWPWSRDKLAKLVDSLYRNGAELIVFDIILSETEKNDAVLAKSLSDSSNVYLPVVFDEFAAKIGEKKGAEAMTKNEAALEKTLVQNSFTVVNNPDEFNNYTPIIAHRILKPVPALINDAAGLGSINMTPDDDGVLRWETMVIGFEGSLYQAITLKAAAAYLGVPNERIELDAAKGIKIGKRYIPTDRWGRTLINYYGPEGTFKHISVSDIIEGKAPPQSVKGRIVLVGSTAIGIYDLRVTPLSPAMPGIEKHASVITSILEEKFLKRAPDYVNFLLLIASGLLVTILIPKFRSLFASIISASFVLMLLALSYYLMTRIGSIVYTGYPSLNVILIFVTVTAYRYAKEEQSAKRVRAIFSSYVTKRVVDELIKNPQMAKLGGERREVTVMFSDIRGFTTISEKHSPEEVVAILNEYLGAMTDVIFRWEGTLDKFIGDAIVVFWGAPLKQDNHAELAVKCALNMIAKLEELQVKWKTEGKPVLNIGVGLNTGEVLVGNIGAEGKKMDYTVIGDNVNLGSRVESLTKKYSAHILITESTKIQLQDAYNAKRFGHLSIIARERVVVKGKEKPVGLYEIQTVPEGAEPVIKEFSEDDQVVIMKEK